MAELSVTGLTGTGAILGDRLGRHCARGQLIGLFLELRGHLTKPLGHRGIRAHARKPETALHLLAKISGI